MDIRIGSLPPVGSRDDGRQPGPGAVEARVLAVRRPRRRGDSVPPVERRAGDQQPDPPGGRVLVLMIPDGSALPEGIESGRIRVFLRFARR